MQEQILQRKNLVFLLHETLCKNSEYYRKEKKKILEYKSVNRTLESNRGCVRVLDLKTHK